MDYLTMIHVLSGMEYLSTSHGVSNFYEIWFGESGSNVLHWTPVGDVGASPIGAEFAPSSRLAVRMPALFPMNLSRRQLLTRASLALGVVGIPAAGAVPATKHAAYYEALLTAYGSVSRFRWNDETKGYDRIEFRQWGKPPSNERIAELEKNLKENVADVWEDRGA